MHEIYIIECRDAKGQLLDYIAERKIREAHPYLFSRAFFTIDELAWWASYGEGRDKPVGPMNMLEVFARIGVTYRRKTW